MTHVIAAVDHSLAATTVCDYAIWASQQMQAPLKFLHVLDNGRYPAPQDFSGSIGLGAREHLLEELATLDETRGRLAREHGQHLLDAAKQRAKDAGMGKPHCSLRHGDFNETVKELEDEIRLLVIGRQGESTADLSTRVGSHIETIARTLSRPILITPNRFQTPQRFLIAYDGSSTSRTCVQMIAKSPMLKNMECYLLLVGDANEDNQNHIKWATELLMAEGFRPTAEIRAGHVEDTILHFCEEAKIDLIAMGAYGHSRIRQFLVGSTTSNLMARSPVPLLLLR